MLEFNCNKHAFNLNEYIYMHSGKEKEKQIAFK